MEAGRRTGGIRLAVRWSAGIVMYGALSLASIAQLANHVVISEIYGGGGNSGSTYKNDYIELYNPTNSAIAMVNWSVQYASANGSFTSHNSTIYSGTIGAHGFFLIQEDTGTGGILDLPAPDAFGGVNMSSSVGKIALVNDTTVIDTSIDPTVVDFVGYGSANSWEGTGPTPALNALKSAERKAREVSTASSMKFSGEDSLKGNGWDSENNDSDFVVRTGQNPQNSSSTLEDTSSGDSVTTTYPVKSGWSMISVPLEVLDFRTVALYPSASSSAFRYDGAYKLEDTLSNAVGYWLRFSSDTDVVISGYTRGSATVPVVDGWNLIGTPSTDVHVATIESNPPGIITSSFFGFAGAYSAVDVLAPSKAYWVKINGSGSLSLISGATVEPSMSGAIEGSHVRSFTFIDGEGKEQTLHVGHQRDVLVRWRTSELPPLPPKGTFDVRFASQRSIGMCDDGSSSLQHLPIEMQADAYPVTLRWYSRETGGEKYFLTAGSHRIAQLAGTSGSIMIRDPIAEPLGLDIVRETSTPAEYSLTPCFPNPFNPSTRFSITIPNEEPVQVGVYDLLGRLVQGILDGPISIGTHSLEWDGRLENGQAAPGGIYFVHLASPSTRKVEKMVLLR